MRCPIPPAVHFLGTGAAPNLRQICPSANKVYMSLDADHDVGASRREEVILIDKSISQCRGPSLLCIVVSSWNHQRLAKGAFCSTLPYTCTDSLGVLGELQLETKCPETRYLHVVYSRRPPSKKAYLLHTLHGLDEQPLKLFLIFHGS